MHVRPPLCGELLGLEGEAVAVLEDAPVPALAAPPVDEAHVGASYAPTT